MARQNKFGVFALEYEEQKNENTVDEKKENKTVQVANEPAGQKEEVEKKDIPGQKEEAQKTTEAGKKQGKNTKRRSRKSAAEDDAGEQATGRRVVMPDPGTPEYQYDPLEKPSVPIMFRIPKSTREKLSTMIKNGDIISANAAVNELLLQFIGELERGDYTVEETQTVVLSKKTERTKDGRRIVSKPVKKDPLDTSLTVKLKPSVHEYLMKQKTLNKIRSLNGIVNQLLNELLGT